MTGDQLRRLRKRLGLTQTELGEQLDVDRGTVANYEANRQRGTDRSSPIPKMVELGMRIVALKIMADQIADQQSRHADVLEALREIENS